MDEWQDFADKIEWEGQDYVFAEMSSDTVPASVAELHSVAQTAISAFWAAARVEAGNVGVDLDV